MQKKLDLGVNAGLTNAEYHAEKNHLSSSNLKLLLSSPQEFYNQKILGIKPEFGNQSAMDLGSYVHGLILEPEKINEEFAFYKGWTKRGKEFDAFKAANPGKIIISDPQAHSGKMLAKSVEACAPAVQLLQGGLPELSLAAKMLDVPVKMRADYLQPQKRYIVDVKTTRYDNNSMDFKRTVKQLGYDLSASLYCEIAHQIYGQLFDFYWVVISKSDISTVCYKASSQTLSDGAALVTKALVTYKKCLEQQKWPSSVDELPNLCNDLEIEEI